MYFYSYVGKRYPLKADRMLKKKKTAEEEEEKKKEKKEKKGTSSIIFVDHLWFSGDHGRRLNP